MVPEKQCTSLARPSIIYLCLCVVLLSSRIILAQSQSVTTIDNDDSFISTLLSDTPNQQREVSRLLKAHPDLVNPQLWGKVVDQMSGVSPERALKILEVAKQIANELNTVEIKLFDLPAILLYS